jgi:cell division protein FtsL
MKGIGKILISMSFGTFLLFLYVHAQVSLVSVSYSLDRQSKKLAESQEEYRRLKFEVEQLRAPRRLEEKMKEWGLELSLPKEVRVVRVPMPDPVEAQTMTEEIQLQPFSKGLMDFLGRWVKVAQAKTER